MKPWQEDHIQALLTSQCENTLFDALISLGSALDFDFCAYGIRSPLPLSRPRIVMFNNYPSDWQLRYQQREYLNIDPTVQLGMRTLLPIIWNDELFSDAHELWEDARSFGLHNGWAQPVHDAYGVVGMLTLSRSSESFTESEIYNKREKILWLTQIAHLGMTQHLYAKILPETDIKLSPRELTTLRWTADGKTSGEISQILGISERTVNFHINNAMEKLGACNKLSATVKAAVLGLLY